VRACVRACVRAFDRLLQAHANLPELRPIKFKGWRERAWLHSVHVHTCPHFDMDGGSDLFFVVKQSCEPRKRSSAEFGLVRAPTLPSSLTGGECGRLTRVCRVPCVCRCPSTSEMRSRQRSGWSQGSSTPQSLSAFLSLSRFSTSSGRCCSPPCTLWLPSCSPSRGACVLGGCSSPIELCGDIKIEFWDEDFGGAEKCCVICFHVGMEPDLLALPRAEIDGAVKDKHCKHFDEDFHIELLLSSSPTSTSMQRSSTGRGFVCTVRPPATAGGAVLD
jgi:hypothetical protein